MSTIIVSDVHLGSRYCLADEFARFVGSLPRDATLVLNGDTVDYRHRGLAGQHRAALDRLRVESLARRIVWVRGNHDERFVLAEPGRIEMTPGYSVGKQLFVAHGFLFDRIMPRQRLFLVLFRFFHRTRVWLGAPSVHVAHYAKKFRWLYRILTEQVARRAVAFARQNGYEAVTCGHTHHIEDRTLDGIRYINTGSCTERPLVYLAVDDERIELRQAENGLAFPGLSG